MHIATLIKDTWSVYKVYFLKLSYPYLIYYAVAHAPLPFLYHLVFHPIFFLLFYFLDSYFIWFLTIIFFPLAFLNIGPVKLLLIIFSIKTSFYCLTKKPLGRFGVFNFLHFFQFIKMVIYVYAKIFLGILLFVIPGFLWGRKLFFAPIIALVEDRDVNSVFISKQLFDQHKSFVTKLFIMTFLIVIFNGYIHVLLPSYLNMGMATIIVFVFIVVNSFGWLYLVNCYIKLKESTSKEVLIPTTNIEPKEPSMFKVIGLLILPSLIVWLLFSRFSFMYGTYLFNELSL